MFKKVLEWIKKNWLLIGISILFLGITFYSANNTSYASDDYPYSMFYRGGARITNIIQIIKNQVSDYLNISGRFITNGLGQFLLMFPRPIYSILNAFMLLVSALLSLKIIEEYNPKVKNRFIIFTLITGLYFAMDQVKYLGYWVMGSSNYVFTLPLMLLFIYLTKKIGLFKYPKLTGLYIAFASVCHESIMIFFIIYILGSIIHDLLQKEKFNKWYILYIIMAILGGSILLLSPGNLSRGVYGYEGWNEMNIIEKLLISIPAVSKLMFGVNSYHNIIPFIFILTISISLFVRKDSVCKLLACSTLGIYILASLLNDGWLYFIAILLLFISEGYYHFIQKDYKLIVISLSFYAIVYAMIITPEFFAGRPNFFMYWYMLIIIGLLISRISHKYINILVSILIILLALTFSIRDIKAYKKLGVIVDARNAAIEKAKETNADIVYIKKIPDELTMFQMDPNTLADENYWAHQHFCNYYGLNKEIKIELID